MRPSGSYADVEDLLRKTSDAVEYILKNGGPPLGGFNDVRPVFRRLELGASLNPGELLGIAGIFRASASLQNHSKGNRLRSDNHIIQNIDRLIINKNLEDKISRSIANEEEVSDNASPLLNSIRRKIKKLQASIKSRLNDIIKSDSVRKSIQESVVTIRNGRFVIPVKLECKNDVPGLVHDFSSSGATAYIEPMAVVEANNEIRRQLSREKEEVERILKELSDEARQMLPQLREDFEILGVLDSMFARAKFCLDYNCTCPSLNIDGCINLKKGRHPLLDRRTAVPIDFVIGKDYSTVVITGPNTGGKTVSLKTVGLLTLMAQAGLHIPAADGSEVRVFEEIYADIGDEQSIEQSLSTFSSHMTNIIKILRSADDKSLVLFDELGAGTDPAEGSALGISILEEMKSRGTYTVATTHYTEIKLYAIRTDGVENASCEFDAETLRPTFRLLIGVPGKSNAFLISRRLGLDETIIDKAREFMKKEDLEFEDILQAMEADRGKIEKDRLETEKNRIAIEKLRAELEDQRDRLRISEDKILRSAREEARRILSEARSEASGTIAELKKLKKEITDKSASVTYDEYSAALGTADDIGKQLGKGIAQLDESLAIANNIPDDIGSEPPKDLKTGDHVRIITLGLNGIILEIPEKEEGDVLVSAGAMRINVPLSNLRAINKADGMPGNKRKTGKTNRTAAITPAPAAILKSRSIAPQIDIRGSTAFEAVEKVDKYLDDASLSGLAQVTLIHGIGTGALKSAIHEYLKDNPHVKAFRPGRHGEGDAGVTIVELK